MLHPAVNWLHQSITVMEHKHYTISGRAPVITGAFVSFAVLTTITTALRIYVRRSVLKIFGPDDWTSVVGWLLFIAYCALIIGGCHHGLGQSTDRISPSDLPTALKLWWTAELLNILCFATVKTSISLQLLHYVVETYQKWLILGVTGLLLVYSVALFFLYIFQCMPPSLYWTQLQGDTVGACLKFEIIRNTGYAYTSLTLVVDLTMAVLPWLMVGKMQLALKTRVMVSIILGIGSIALIATIIRIPYLNTLADPTAFLYNASDVWIWSCAEVGLSLSASSAVTLKPLFNKLISKQQSSTTASNSSGDQEVQLKKMSLSGNTTQMTGATLVDISANDSHFLEGKATDNFNGQDFPKIVRRGTALADL